MRLDSESLLHVRFDFFCGERDAPDFEFVYHAVEEVGVPLIRGDGHALHAEVHARITTGLRLAVHLAVDIHHRIALVLRADEVVPFWFKPDFLGKCL